MIVNDQSPRALVTASLLTIGLFLASGAASRAADPASGAASSATADAASSTATAVPTLLTVTVLQDGVETTFTTTAHTVADLLDERGIRVAPGDFVAPDPAATLSDGARVVLRTAQPVQLRIGSSIRVIRTAAVNVGDFLRGEHVAIGRDDQVIPARDARIAANQTIRVIRIARWTAHERIRMAPAVVHRTDATMPAGHTETVAQGAPGLRVAIVRYTRRDDGVPEREVLASRIVREPQPRIVVRGIATYQSLAKVATQGFESAVHLAGKALHMIATAYTAGCYGCSGITASGVRAGFGIIAVDPSVIPLGTKVFIPGYGRAVAGDTGGAIQGHRVDLGMNSEAAALQFGRRPVTIYVLR